MENYESTSSQEFAHVQKKPGFINNGIAFVVVSYIAVVSTTVGSIMKGSNNEAYQVSPQIEEVQSQFSDKLADMYLKSGIGVSIPQDLTPEIIFVSDPSLEDEFGKVDIKEHGSYIVRVDGEGIENIIKEEESRGLKLSGILDVELVKYYTEINEVGSAVYHNFFTEVMNSEYDREKSEIAGNLASFMLLRNNIEKGKVTDSLVVAVYLMSVRYGRIISEQDEDYALSFPNISKNFEKAFDKPLAIDSLQVLLNTVARIKKNGDHSHELREITSRFIQFVGLYEQSFRDIVMQDLSEFQKNRSELKLVSGAFDNKIKKI
ncbi:hypothetical protein A9Q91_00495 [Candidatus Gracilibacteria bacterium 28_42_T64]|nr:hypothetical protein A9Q91_00495 [Candidatus Gracilibacteria bacterium 28_42_T64]